MGRAFEFRKTAKLKRWGKMSRIFPRLSKAITFAAKESGMDPALNARLRHAIANAKAENMPKDNIEAAIKRAGGKDLDTISEVNYEGKGPHGVLVFVECATDNTTRTVANIKMYLSKYGAGIVPTGSLEFMFSRKAVIEFPKPKGISIEDLEFELIDAGLEEIIEEDGIVVAYADWSQFGSLTKAIEEKGIEIKSANLQRFAENPQSFTEEQMADIGKLLEKIEDDDDVQAVYTNMA